MSNQSFVLQVDTPSIKKYVFGTDSLKQVRGASALLNWLNRTEMSRVLCEHIGKANMDTIYANGGSAQFLLRRCSEETVDAACSHLARHIRLQTGGEVQTVFGLAQLQGEDSYGQATRLAHFRLRSYREFASSRRSVSTMPPIMECSSASHLPAEHRANDGNEMLSEACRQKVRAGQQALIGDLWSGWMEHLQKGGPWPDRARWKELRCSGMTAIGECSPWHNYVGLVYADGNSMGQIVQALDRPETLRCFSQIVDKSIRAACYSGLDVVVDTEVKRTRYAVGRDDRLESLPADILLLGGDDLLVVVPASRALEFAQRVTDEFERQTHQRITALPDENMRCFFQRWLGDTGFTISCGVAIAKSTYPFYLSLDLAEDLLRSAKRRMLPETPSGVGTERSAARIDFHVVAGASSHVLDHVRRDTYQVDKSPRTLRPMTTDQIELLRTAVHKLRRVNFPRSKLHELEDAALLKEQNLATRRIRDIFARSRHGSEHSQRHALWTAVKILCPENHTFEFPWFLREDQKLSCIPDLVDAYDLFGPEKRQGP